MLKNGAGMGEAFLLLARAGRKHRREPGKLENRRTMWALAIVVLAAAAGYWHWRRSGKPWLLYATYWSTRVYSQLWHRCSYHGRLPWPQQGPMLVVSNHTCSADPPFLMGTSPRFLSFVTAQREHFRINWLFHWYLREVWVCAGAIGTVEDPVAARQRCGYKGAAERWSWFPESNLAGVAKNRLRPGKHGAAFLALASGAPVYPVYITGGPRTHHLLRAWLWASRPAVRVYFGPAVDLSAYQGQRRTRALLEEVTLLLMRRIEALNPSPLTRGGDSDEQSGNRDRTDAQAVRPV